MRGVFWVAKEAKTGRVVWRSADHYLPLWAARTYKSPEYTLNEERLLEGAMKDESGSKDLRYRPA